MKTPDDQGVPDGMTVDAQGNVWSTRWDGSCVVQYGTDGNEKSRLAVPVKKVSSVAFGGPDYTHMYLTTAGGNNKDMDGQHAGALYSVTGHGTRGVAEFCSRI